MPSSIHFSLQLPILFVFLSVAIFLIFLFASRWTVLFAHFCRCKTAPQKHAARRQICIILSYFRRWKCDTFLRDREEQTSPRKRSISWKVFWLQNFKYTRFRAYTPNHAPCSPFFPHRPVFFFHCRWKEENFCPPPSIGKLRTGGGGGGGLAVLLREADEACFRDVNGA